jgi:demethylphylloquinone reductase
MADKKPKIVIVGGGFGGVFTALDLGGAGEVTIISDEDHFLFTPMLYEYLSGEVEAWHIAPEYKELLDEDTNFVRGAVTDIDVDARKVILAGRDSVPYDILILAVGGVTNYAGVTGAEEHTIPFRKLAHADKLRQRMIAALDHIPPSLPPQDVHRALTFAVVGGGASGIELSIKMADLLRDAFRRRALHGEPRVMVVEMSDRVVPGMGDEMRAFVDKALLESRVEVHTETRVVGVAPNSITLEHAGAHTELETAAVVWVAGVRPNPLVEKLNIEKDKRGLIVVEPTLQVKGHDNIFALGDTALAKDVVPTLAGTAQLAFQEATLVARNVREFQRGGKLHTKHFVELGEALSLGTESAAILAAGQVLSGALARQARFAMYTSRLPTWHHRLRVGASWFLGGKEPRPLQPLGLQG